MSCQVLFAIVPCSVALAAPVDLTLEPYTQSTLQPVSTRIDVPDFTDQLEMSRQAILFALSPEGWDLSSLGFDTPTEPCADKPAVTNPCWCTGVRGDADNLEEIQAVLGYQLNEDAARQIELNPTGRIISLFFHTDLWVERLAHCIGESPDNYGVISGTMGGDWTQCPVPDWGRFSVSLATFVRGDSNASNAIDLADATFTLSYLFAHGPAPSCIDAADANDSGAIDIADAVATLNHLFASAGPLPSPFGSCGIDPTTDGLDCNIFRPCRGK